LVLHLGGEELSCRRRGRGIADKLNLVVFRLGPSARISALATAYRYDLS
jgi:hypothetical protein